MLFGKIERDQVSVLSDGGRFYVCGFNRGVRSEVRLYSVAPGLAEGGESKKRAVSDEFLQQIKTIELSKDKISFVGFVTVQAKEKESGRKNKRKLDEERSGRQMAQEEAFLVVVLSCGDVNVYTTTAETETETEPILTILRKKAVKAVFQTSVDAETFCIVDVDGWLETYSVYSGKTVCKTRLSNANGAVTGAGSGQILHVSLVHDGMEIAVVDAGTGEVVDSVDVAKEEETGNVVQIERSLLHADDLLYILAAESSHIYVYSQKSRKIVHRLNFSSQQPAHFGLVQMKQTEYVVGFDRLNTSFEVFKCAFRKNSVNVNTTVQASLDISPDGQAVDALHVVMLANKAAVVAASNTHAPQAKLAAYSLPKLVAAKEKQPVLELVLPEQPKQAKQHGNQTNGSRANISKIKRTGDASLDSLLVEFRAVKGEVEQLVGFCVENNFNIVLIKTVLKNAKPAEIDSLLTAFLKHFFKNTSNTSTVASSDIEDLAYLKLSNWFKYILIANGGYMVKTSTPKKLHLLKRFQEKIRHDNEHLNDLLQLQGKLTLLMSQYELRNQSKVEADQADSAEDDDDEDFDSTYLNSGSKTHKQLLNNVLKDAGSTEGVQLIEEDELIYENGEADEADDNDDEVEEEENEEDED